MDASMTSVVPGSFYFYNPDPNPDARHHGYFVPHPQQMPNMYAAAPMPTLPSTPIYSRPTSSSSAQHQQYQPQHQHQHQVLMPQPPALKSFTGVPNNMLTPMPSPPAGAATALGSNGQQQQQQHHLQLQLQQHYHYQHQQQQLQLQHHAKPTIMLETDVYDADGMRYPSTPPLSTASSAISSPGSCDMLVTPLNPMFSGLENSDNLKKTACVSDSSADSYPIAGWTNSTSPPLTPVYVQAPARTQSANTSAPVSDTQTPAVLTSDLLSVSACPSLSPSPSAYARSVASEQDNDFCDPRNLTVSSVDGLSSEFSAPAAPSSSLCAAGDTDTSQAAESVPASVGDGSGGASASSASDFVVHHGLPNLDEYPDLESEDEFVNGLVNLGAELSPLSHAGTPSLDGLSSRSRASSITSSITSGFELFDAWGSTVDGSEDAQHPTKRQRTASGSVLIMSSSSPSSSLAADAMTTSMTGGSSEQPSEEGHHGHHGHHDHHDHHHEHDGSSSNSPSSSGSDRDSNDNTNRDDGHSAGGSSGNADSPDEGGNNDASTAPTATSRRGRKQSLTDDPSKIFACDLCNRKFRRQEHLKRHYRSLHTQDKPFNCEECGKKFSRSDNLAQHARTHGAAAFVMNLYDDPDMMAAAGAGYPPHPMYAPHPMPMGEDYASMGRVLFQVAAEIPGSASELSSEDGNDNQGKKKRKRSN
ncbi:c2h2 transcription factor [Niveomyces insectorum RCEF 264]|uniref:C2H2-type transcription factor MSN2 n=1 Tax=Niveomyces insectorum RCEF 264 TaxID=1081102 RepID=A0A168ADW9_9HYPO|nr:c2h2 transcription factor [Niveomyces insectorum RCEF 264]